VKSFLKVCLVLAACVTAAAFWQERNPTTFGAWLGAFIGWLVVEDLERRASSRNAERRTADRKLFERVQELFHPNVVSILNIHDFGGPFDSSLIRMLQSALGQLGGAEHTYHSWRLERAKRVMLKTTGSFGTKLAMNTFPLANGAHQKMSDEWRLNDPKKYAAVRKELNRLATQLAKDYDRFVKLGKRILDV
jgi:hypothetical protein